MRVSDDKMARTKSHLGQQVPTFFYGTAWKEEKTKQLTHLALKTGFRAIDTANQRRHYDEAAAGEGIAAAMIELGLRREDLFIQTKFTFVDGQDHRLPYDATAPVATQVQQSFDSSLEHLKSPYIDSYMLHGPSSAEGLTKLDWEAWKAMEAIHKSGKAKLLAVSNVNYGQLEALHRGANVKPAFVQNRCFASTRWDQRIREFCNNNGMMYQGFALLTANAAELRSGALQNPVRRHNRSVAEIVFAFALQSGMIPMTGSSDPVHMRQDLTCYDFELGAGDLLQIENIGG